MSINHMVEARIRQARLEAAEDEQQSRRAAGSQKVYCPACRAVQEGFENLNGVLFVETRHGRLAVTGYVCQGCERVIHWKVRRAKGAE